MQRLSVKPSRRERESSYLSARHLDEEERLKRPNFYWTSLERAGEPERERENGSVCASDKGGEISSGDKAAKALKPKKGKAGEAEEINLGVFP